MTYEKFLDHFNKIQQSKIKFFETAKALGKPVHRKIFENFVRGKVETTRHDFFEVMGFLRDILSCMYNQRESKPMVEGSIISIPEEKFPWEWETKEEIEAQESRFNFNQPSNEFPVFSSPIDKKYHVQHALDLLAKNLEKHLSEKDKVDPPIHSKRKIKKEAFKSLQGAIEDWHKNKEEHFSKKDKDYSILPSEIKITKNGEITYDLENQQYLIYDETYHDTVAIIKGHQSKENEASAKIILRGYGNHLEKERTQEDKKPIDLILYCPMCKYRHVDQGRFETHPHHTHCCQNCGHSWRPAVEHTRGVRFLPGFKDKKKFVLNSEQKKHKETIKWLLSTQRRRGRSFLCVFVCLEVAFENLGQRIYLFENRENQPRLAQEIFDANYDNEKFELSLFVKIGSMSIQINEK